MSRACELLRTYGYTALFSLAIAGLLWTLGVSPSLLTLVVVSCCIGFSMATASVILEEPLGRFLSPYLVPVPVTLIGLAVGLILAGSFLEGPWLFFSDAWDTWIIGTFFGVVGFLLMGAHSRVQTLKAALASAEADRLEQEAMRLETQLRLLQAQIEPHFLFNTLSNVASMIRDSPAEAEATLNNLTTLLRASLRRTRSRFTTLGDELEVVQSYLEIQHIRMGDRLCYRIDVDDELRGMPLPPLLLQPLVENAIRHGIEPAEPGGSVAVRASSDGRVLTLQVADTGVGLEFPGGSDDYPSSSRIAIGRSLPPGGTGIANVLGRLSALYHGCAALRFSSNRPHGVIAVLTLPIEANANSAAG